jgi:hypothetical protein
MQRVGALPIGAGDQGHGWTQHDEREAARSIRPLFYHAFGLIGVGGDDDPLLGREMKIPELIAGRQRRDEHESLRLWFGVRI